MCIRDRVVRAAEYDINVGANDFVTPKAAVNTIYYIYDGDDRLVRKRIDVYKRQHIPAALSAP